MPRFAANLSMLFTEVTFWSVLTPPLPLASVVSNTCSL